MTAPEPPPGPNPRLSVLTLIPSPHEKVPGSAGVNTGEEVDKSDGEELDTAGGSVGQGGMKGVFSCSFRVSRYGKRGVAPVAVPVALAADVERSGVMKQAIEERGENGPQAGKSDLLFEKPLRHYFTSPPDDPEPNRLVLIIGPDEPEHSADRFGLPGSDGEHHVSRHESQRRVFVDLDHQHPGVTPEVLAKLGIQVDELDAFRRGDAETEGNSNSSASTLTVLLAPSLRYRISTV